MHGSIAQSLAKLGGPTEVKLCATSLHVIILLIGSTLTLSNSIAAADDFDPRDKMVSLQAAYKQLPEKSNRDTICLQILEYACRVIPSKASSTKIGEEELPEAAVGRALVSIVQGRNGDLDTSGIAGARLKEIAGELCQHGRFEEAIRLAMRSDVSAADSINIRLTASLLGPDRPETNGNKNADAPAKARMILDEPLSETLSASKAISIAWSAMLCAASNSDAVNCRWFAHWLHSNAEHSEIMYLDNGSSTGLSEVALLQLTSIARELPNSPLRAIICRYVIRDDIRCKLGENTERLAWLEPSDLIKAELYCWKVRSSSGLGKDLTKQIRTNWSMRGQILFNFSNFKWENETVENQRHIIDQLEEICEAENSDRWTRQVHWSLLARIVANVDREKAASILDREFAGVTSDAAVQHVSYENDAFPNLFAANAMLGRFSTCSTLLTSWGQQKVNSELTSSQFIDADMIHTCVAYPGLLDENIVKNRIVVVAGPFGIGLTGPKDIDAMLSLYPEKLDQFWLHAGLLAGELLRRKYIDDNVMWELTQ